LKTARGASGQEHLVCGQGSVRSADVAERLLPGGGSGLGGESLPEPDDSEQQTADDEHGDQYPPSGRQARGGVPAPDDDARGD